MHKSSLLKNLGLIVLTVFLVSCGGNDDNNPPSSSGSSGSAASSTDTSTATVTSTSTSTSTDTTPTRDDEIARLLQRGGAVPRQVNNETIVDARTVHCQKPVPVRIQFVQCTMHNDAGQSLRGLQGNDALEFFDLLSPSVRMNPTVDVPNFDLASITCTRSGDNHWHCSFTQTNSSHAVPNGTWGGNTMEMQVTSGGATYTLSCSNGTIDQPIRPDASGNFHNTGTFTIGGPPRNPPPTPVPATYDGNVTNNVMTVTIHTTANGSPDTSTHTIKFGQRGTFFRCL